MSSHPSRDQPDEPGANAMTDRFHSVGEGILDALLGDSPEWADDLGDHRFSDRLTDYSADGDSRRAGVLTDALGALDEIDDLLLPPADRVDLEMLRNRVSADLWQLSELRPHTWDPLEQLPGDALYSLIAGEDLPAEERLRALCARCAAVPEFLATARTRLDGGPGMPRVHVQTAAARAEGVLALLGDGVDTLVEQVPGLRSTADTARETAAAALREHIAWLRSRAETADAAPRLGARDHAARLWYTLDSELSQDALLTRAESDLLATEEAIAEAAADFEGAPPRPGQVREVLDRIAAEAATTEDTVRPVCEQALDHLADRVRELGFATLPGHRVR